ncbi:Sulfite exporter TauE/SafE [Novymonas esmeraldas]|uniref:Sulfite exporter TauE/SafE n=1 Tax=Novymonas esmeraldas TaxID=1808958 RepID=A0AAW0EUQ1_9TRYP
MAEGETTFLVFFTLAVFNFASSIIQGVAGIGDAILMQVLWLLACDLSTDFNKTPLGDSPVRAVALIMYVRLLFMSPLVVYLGLNDSVFSKQMTIMMAVPSTVLTIVGVFLYSVLDPSALKAILGITCFFFALVYIGIIVYRLWRKRRQVQELKSRNVKLVVEADAIAEEAQLSRNTSMVNLQASFVQNVPNNSIFAVPAHPPVGFNVGAPNIASPPEPSMQGGDTAVAVPGSTVVVNGATEPEIDARTGLPADTTEAYLSTIGGEVFAGPERQARHVNEENVPPLTPSKISPSRTMTFTRVRINRNIDANGKIKMSTKIGAAVAASLAGLMASLTGVNAPPQIIFILLFDAPNYIVRVNFSAQSIPSNIVRFIMAAFNGSFTWAMLPLMIDVVVFGFAGVFVGNRVGRLLGPQSFNVFVLCLLLLCSLAMVGKWQKLLLFCTFLTGVITVVCGYLENKRNKPIIEKQRLSELEVEKRLYDCFEELQRNNNSFVQPSASMSASTALEHFQRSTRPKPMWGGANFDNDDEGAGGENDISLVSAPSPTGTTQRGTANESGASHHALKQRTAGAAPPPAAVVANGHADSSPANGAGEDVDERTTPALVGGAASASSDKDEEEDGYVPSTSRTLPHNDRSVPSEADQYRPERQSPSLRSLNSSLQNVPSDEDGLRKR